MAETQQTTAQRTPRASRPVMPGYGVPEGEAGMLPWSHAVERLAAAKNYWVATADANGQPHAVPVWGIWVEDALYFGVGPRSARNIAANPSVSVHLESGDEVVILEGEAAEVHDPAPEVSKVIDDESARKYDWRPSTEGSDPVGEGYYVVRPKVAYAWTSFPADATRWHFS